MIWPFVIGIGAIVIGLLGLLIASRPNEYRIERSEVMSAPPAKVFEQVNDFHNWEAWSPWAKLDPNCKNVYEGAPAGQGAGFFWDGNSKVGSGRMTIIESRPHDLIRIKLEFYRPFKNICTTEYTFQPEGSQTRMTWTMMGQNNFMGKAFSMMCNMDKMLGKDFEKGLAAIKGIVEK